VHSATRLEISSDKLVERDVAKSLSHKVNKNIALNASLSDKVESSPKALKSRKEDSSPKDPPMKR
jgi:hypothetical protein